MTELLIVVASLVVFMATCVAAINIIMNKTDNFENMFWGTMVICLVIMAVIAAIVLLIVLGGTAVGIVQRSFPGVFVD